MYLIYWLYVVCRYPGVAASRPPMPRPANIPVLLGGETAQSLHPASIPVPLDGAGALSAQCLRPASIPGLLGGAGAYIATPESSSLSMRLGI